MKAASGATLAILAAGQYLKFEFFTITLTDGTVLRFTNGDIPLTVGGNTYLTGLVIHRGPITMKMGLEPQEFDLTIAPQWDNPGGAVTVGGYPFLQAVNLGILDGAGVVMQKGFFNAPAAGTAKVDTTPGLVPWASGVVGTAVASRSVAMIPVIDRTALLNVAMPRNVVQPGCVHTLFDAGCGLVRASFTTTGVLTGTPGVLSFNTNLTQVINYFDLGTITMTSGVCVGLKRTVKLYLNSSGNIQLINPFPFAPTAGDTFSIVPSCLKTQAACTNASAGSGPPFNNLARFRGMPYVPVPETLYDGGTPNSAAPAIGSQGGAGAGSSFSGVVGPNTYTP